MHILTANDRINTDSNVEVSIAKFRVILWFALLVAFLVIIVYVDCKSEEVEISLRDQIVKKGESRNIQYQSLPHPALIFWQIG